MFKGRHRFKPSDFMPDFTRRKDKPKTGAEVWKKVRSVMGHYVGRKDKR